MKLPSFLKRLFSIKPANLTHYRLDEKSEPVKVTSEYLRGLAETTGDGEVVLREQPVKTDVILEEIPETEYETEFAQELPQTEQEKAADEPMVWPEVKPLSKKELRGMKKSELIALALDTDLELNGREKKDDLVKKLFKHLSV